jgi:N-acetyl-gamma-glutamyl-phosphate reductase
MLLQTQSQPGSGSPGTVLSSVRVAVLGATGYAGQELVRILSRHPRVRLTSLMSSGRAAKASASADTPHPVHRSKAALRIASLDSDSLTPDLADVVFLATPHEFSLDLAPRLLERGLRVIDLSGAFRLRDAGSYPLWYGFQHDAAAALEEAVYGMPELEREKIRHARLVANPGCYATSVILGLAPLLRAGWADTSAGIIADCKSGATGAGRSARADLMFCEVNENIRAYGLFHHRHVPEMLQALELAGQQFVFTPHLLPVERGILSTLYVKLAGTRSLEQVHDLYADFYLTAPAVRVYQGGALPDLKAVARTPFLDVGFALDELARRLIVVSALDNLGKGAASQAVQNMNLMMGYAEDQSLA